MSETIPEFSIFTATRYDPILLDSEVNGSLSFSSPSPFYMLVYHRDRMLEAARHFQWPKVIETLLDGKSFEQSVTKNIESYIQENDTGSAPLKVNNVSDIFLIRSCLLRGN